MPIKVFLPWHVGLPQVHKCPTSCNLKKLGVKPKTKTKTVYKSEPMKSVIKGSQTLEAKGWYFCNFQFLMQC